MDNIDTILYINNTINEDNSRMYTNKAIDARNKGSENFVDDPAMFGQMSFGRDVQNALNSIGKGWTSQVTDFKKWVVADICYHDYITGRSSSKMFLIVFENKNGDGIVMSTHNKWRSVSGFSQAVNYIRSVAQQLKQDSQKKL